MNATANDLNGELRNRYLAKTQEGRSDSSGNGKKKSSSAQKERIRILIADDQTVVREGLIALAKRKSDMVVVAEASNGRETVDLWKQYHPDVTLLDLRM